MTESLSSVFYAMPADERAAEMEKACEKYRVEDFFDLDPEQRHAVYEKVAAANR